jgi:hypothetical protein
MRWVKAILLTAGAVILIGFLQGGTGEVLKSAFGLENRIVSQIIGLAIGLGICWLVWNRTSVRAWANR